MAFSFSPKIVTDGLVLALDAANPRSYVSGSTVWSDLSFNLVTGSLVNGPIFTSANLGSLSFDGSNDYVEFGDILNFDINNKFSMSVWIRTSSTALGVQNVIAKEVFNSPYTGYQFAFNNLNGNAAGVGKIGVSIATVPFTSVPVSVMRTMTVNTFNDGNWKNLCFTYDGSATVGGILIYANGILQSVTTQDAASLTGTMITTKTFQIGIRDTSAQPFNGNVAMVGVYNRTLSPTEVLQNYNALKPRFNLT